jgi:hypothetical protein
MDDTGSKPEVSYQISKFPPGDTYFFQVGGISSPKESSILKEEDRKFQYFAIIKKSASDGETRGPERFDSATPVRRWKYGVNVVSKAGIACLIAASVVADSSAAVAAARLVWRALALPGHAENRTTRSRMDLWSLVKDKDPFGGSD